jgi:hypothetical protein
MKCVVMSPNPRRNFVRRRANHGNNPTANGRKDEAGIAIFVDISTS